MAIDIILTPRSTLSKAVLAMGEAADAIRALEGRDPRDRFDLVIFASKEDPAPPQVFGDPSRKVRVFSLALTDDGQFSKDQAFIAGRAADMAAAAFVQGQRVLVTSSQGRNRAGLVTALAVQQLTQMDGAGAVRWVKARRVQVPKEALTNQKFVHLLSNLMAKRSGKKPFVEVDRFG